MLHGDRLEVDVQEESGGPPASNHSMGQPLTPPPPDRPRQHNQATFDVCAPCAPIVLISPMGFWRRGGGGGWAGVCH